MNWFDWVLVAYICLISVAFLCKGRDSLSPLTAVVVTIVYNLLIIGIIVLKGI